MLRPFFVLFYPGRGIKNTTEAWARSCSRFPPALLSRSRRLSAIHAGPCFQFPVMPHPYCGPEVQENDGYNEGKENPRMINYALNHR
jgi:hypothetical protein